MVGHFFLFYKINGKLIEELSVSQSWITASSFFLMTLVKGALTMCVGTCYVQYLWSILREEYASVVDIDRMFGLRRSLFAILDPRALWKTPLLFSMAVYIWLLNVALIYPPSALTVSMDPRHLIQSANSQF